MDRMLLDLAVMRLDAVDDLGKINCLVNELIHKKSKINRQEINMLLDKKSRINRLVYANRHEIYNKLCSKYDKSTRNKYANQ